MWHKRSHPFSFFESDRGKVSSAPAESQKSLGRPTNHPKFSGHSSKYRGLPATLSETEFGRGRKRERGESLNCQSSFIDKRFFYCSIFVPWLKYWWGKQRVKLIFSECTYACAAQWYNTTNNIINMLTYCTNTVQLYRSQTLWRSINEWRHWIFKQRWLVIEVGFVIRVINPDLRSTTSFGENKMSRKWPQLWRYPGVRTVLGN